MNSDKVSPAVRDEYIDFLRGLAILFVVPIHTFPVEFGSANPFNSLWNFDILLRQAITTVPIFLAISGFIFSKKEVSSTASYFAFEKKQILRVYIPCLIWSFPMFCMYVFHYKASLWLAILLLFVGGYLVYHFAFLIIQFYLLLPVIQKFVARCKYSLSISLMVTALSVIPFCLLEYRYNISLPRIIYSALFPVFLAYFCIGVYFGQGKQIRIGWKYLLIIVVLLWGVKYLESYLLWNKYQMASVFGIRKLSHVMYAFALLLFLFSVRPLYRSNFLCRYLAKIGKCAFGIYLIHMYFVIYGVNLFTPDAHWLLNAVVVFIVSYLIVYYGRKFLPSRVSRYLGF